MEVEGPAVAASVAAVEKFLAYCFSDPSLLVEALTHSTHTGCGPTYQRLEFIGDAALTLALSNYLYLTNPSSGPGRLSALRSANISTEKLARIAVRHSLYRFLLRCSPSLDAMVDEFVAAVKAEEVEDGYNPTVYGGTTVRAPKVLADLVESIIGAVYVDCNFNLESTWVVVRGMLEPIITAENHHDQPVSMLYELCQKQGKSVEFRNWVRESGNVSQAFVDGKLVGTGFSEQKNIAKLNAARDALPKIWEEVDRSSRTGSGSGGALAYGDPEKDGKKILNELCNKNRWRKPIYRLISENGPGHDKKFQCSVNVSTSYGAFHELGDFKSRLKDAESSAAYKVLAELAQVVGGK